MVRVSWLAIPLLVAACGLGPAGRSSGRTALSGDGGALQGYNVAPGQVAVAGISSGGFMAVQLHVAYSGTFQRGAAVFAGGPFYCAQDSIATAELDCMLAQGTIDLNQLEATTDSWASSGDVDPTSNLSGAQVWLWSGTQDTTVKQPVMDALQSYYQHYGASVVYENSTAAGHAWISPDVTTSCSAQQSPYINNCNVDAEQAFLGQFFGSLQPRSTSALAGAFVAFDQNEFLDDGNAGAHSLDSTGYLYVPPACAAGSACRLVVALHGCDQSYGQIGDTFLRKSGLDEWADTNDLLILYPQATTSSANASGCWDWWGYDDANYAKKSGRQMLAVKRMVDRITGGPVVGTSSSSGSAASSASSASSSSGGTTGGFCAVFTDNNYNQVQAGRAYQGSGGACPMGHACAVGSNDDMGLYNTFLVTTLVESPAGYYSIGTGCPSTSGTSTSATSGSTGSGSTSGASSTGAASTGTASTGAASTGAATTSGSSGSTATGSSGAGTSSGGTTSGGSTAGASSSGAGSTGASASTATSGSSGSTAGHAKGGGCGSAGGAASLWALLALVALGRPRRATT